MEPLGSDRPGSPISVSPLMVLASVSHLRPQDSHPRQADVWQMGATWGIGLERLGLGGLGWVGHSPVGAAGPVPITGGEEGLVHTLHEGLRDRVPVSPDGTHPTAVGVDKGSAQESQNRTQE